MWNKIIQDWRLVTPPYFFCSIIMSVHNVTAPKGLLKLLILDLSTKNPISGTDIMNHIKSITNGYWSPSPGSVYLILKNLLKQEYLTEIYSQNTNVKKYVATSKAKSFIVLEKEKLHKSLTRNLYSIIIMGDLLNSDDISVISNKIEKFLESYNPSPKKLVQ